MRRNIIGMIFLVLIAFVALVFIVKAGFAIFSYYQYSLQVPIQIEKWTVEEVHADKFSIIAHFSYEYHTKGFRNKASVGEFYPNPWAASKAQKLYSSEKWAAWLNPKHPEQALLEKKFPYKKAISAAILIGLFIYFAILSTYLRVKTQF